ncbi:MAG: UPF0261 family protein, partial [Paracoccaceae bacterium]
LTYMVALKPALEARGYEVAVFHATGMGGRAFESLAAAGAFACVMDFCTQELGNDLHGSRITAGSDRLTGAGRSGTPQIVAPGCYDLVDIVGWEDLPDKWAGGHLTHAHNRLLTSVVLNTDERVDVARAHGQQLAAATGQTAFLLPTGGCGEWDRPGADLYDPDGLAAFCDAMQQHIPEAVAFHTLDCHVNDPAFVEAALRVFDDWVARGIVKSP